MLSGENFDGKNSIVTKLCYLVLGGTIIMPNWVVSEILPRRNKNSAKMTMKKNDKKT